MLLNFGSGFLHHPQFIRRLTAVHNLHPFASHETLNRLPTIFRRSLVI